MKCAHLLTAFVAGSLMACGGSRQGTAAAPNATTRGMSAAEVDAALRSAAPDVDRRLARFKPVRMTFDAGGLSDRERQMIDQLVASRARSGRR